MRIRPALLALFFVAHNLSGQSAAQEDSSGRTQRIARLAALGRVWGAVKYFHPYLAYRPIDWDSAFFSAYPLVNRARTPAEVAAAVQAMLDVLGDPVTRVTGTEPPPVGRESASPGPSSTLTRWLPDSTLVIRFSAVGDLEDYPGVLARLDSAGDLVDPASGVVLDLRGTQVAADPNNDEDIAAYFHEEGQRTPFDGHLVTSPVTAPPQRARMYSGFPPQTGGTSGGYYAGFYTIDGTGIVPSSGARRHPLAAIVDRHSSVPTVIPALQALGAMVVVAIGGTPGVDGAGSHTLEITDGLRVVIRTSEPADGRGALHADTTLALGGDEETAVEVAAALLRRASPAGGSTAGRPEAVPAATYRAEQSYATTTFPDSAHRVLAAYRFWTAINYFYPYRHLIGEDWNAVLPAAIAGLEQAGDSLAYARAVAAMVRHIHDSHGFMISAVLRQHIGSGRAPVRVGIIEGRPVITTLLDSAAGRAGLRVGDEILVVNGEAARTRLARVEVPGATSTPQAEAEYRSELLLRGPVGSTMSIVVRGRDGRRRAAELNLVPWSAELQAAQYSGAVFRLLPGNVGYADLSRLTVPQVDTMFEQFKDTRAIIFDMRGYPNGTAWAIAPRLADRPGKAAAIFRRPLRTSPDTTEHTTVEFTQRIPTSAKPRYAGRTIMLIDAHAASQAEHTGLFFEAANGTKFVGSPTVGANGDVTDVVLPGGIVAYFSGHDVRHADGRQLQRLGLQPDVVVYPTIAGVRAGRDEVLEAALRLLGVAGRSTAVGPVAR